MSEQESKKQILKSTGILGSVQVINILLGIVRIKVLAVLLGPAGVGVAGIYQATIALISSATGLGINYSGVRDIAAAAATNDANQIARTALVLRRWAWFTGIAGMVLAIAFCRPLSKAAFGDESYAWGIAVLSVSILLTALTGGMAALLQGLRQIGSMAKASIVGAFVGLLVVVVVYYFLGFAGIVPAILLTSLIAQVITWYYVKKVAMPKVHIGYKETVREGKGMARLGFFLVISSISGNAVMYVVRSFIVQRGGIESVGHFIAAWTISSMYMSAVFNAMGADYYPRLSSVQNDNAAMTRLVNEQTEMALLLTAPIIICMVSFIDLAVKVFYSREFSATAAILNWQLLGDFIKVLSWPLGYILLAKAMGKLYILTETVWNLLYISIVYFGWQLFTIEITGIAFVAAYLANFIIILLLAKRLIRFVWSANVVKYVLVFLPILLLVFCSSRYLPGAWRYINGALATGAALMYSYVQLRGVINLRGVFARLRFKMKS